MSVADENSPTRHSLLGRLKNRDDQESWRVFFETYWKLIYDAGIEAGLTPAEAEDVVQETVIEVSERLPAGYDARKGHFKHWLLRLTSWRIQDQWRKRDQASVQNVSPSQEPTTDTCRTSTIDRLPDPASFRLEAHWEQNWEKNLMDAAVQRVKKKINPKHYQIFDLYVRKEWPVAEVAQAMQVSTSKVYVIKHRVSDMIKQEIEYLRTKLY